MPNARHALDVLARAGDTWPGHRDDWASTASGGIRMRPPQGQKPLGQGISHTHGGELCIIFLTTLVGRPLNAALLGACSTEMMQDYPLHVSD